MTDESSGRSQGGASSNDHLWSRNRYRSGSISAACGRFQEGPRLRGLGRAHAVAALQRRQTKAWCDLENGRTNVATLADRPVRPEGLA